MKKMLLPAVLVALALGAALPARSADDYTHSVNEKIAKTVVYPRMAKLRNVEGKVGYLVKIDAQGGVMETVIETSSGNAILDTAVEDGIKQSVPFPAPSGAPATVRGVMNFVLNN